MHRVYVAWDGDEARRFLEILEGHGIRGRIIEDREFPAPGEHPHAEPSPEVWISDAEQLETALKLASDFENDRLGAAESG